jgi:hypothetical protein
MPDPDELVLFMALPYGVEETIIPGVLASRNIPFFLFENHPAEQPWYVEIKVPASRVEDARRALADAKHVGELLDRERNE